MYYNKNVGISSISGGTGDECNNNNDDKIKSKI